MPTDNGLAHGVYDSGRSWLPLTRIPLPHKPEAASRARRHTREVLALRRVDAELTATVELVVSELVTNAVRHGVCLCGCTRGPVSLRILRTENRLRVEVADPSRTPPRWPVGPAPAGVDASDPAEGRGLLLVTALAADWGDHAGPVRGKVVWCEFAGRRRVAENSCPQPVDRAGRPDLTPAQAHRPHLGSSEP